MKNRRIFFSIVKSLGKCCFTSRRCRHWLRPRTYFIRTYSLDIRRKEAIALVGPNGIGKSTLLKSIIDRIPFIKGSKTFGTNVSVGYYDQEQANLHGNKTVLAELWDEHPTTPEKEIRSILGGFLFSGDDVEKRFLY